MAKYKITQRVEHVWYLETGDMTIEDICDDVVPGLDPDDAQVNFIMEEWIYELGSEIVYTPNPDFFERVFGIENVGDRYNGDYIDLTQPEFE